MIEITAETKLPLTSGKEATLKLKVGAVSFSMPASFKTPTATLADLRVALEELEAIQMASAPAVVADGRPENWNWAIVREADLPRLFWDAGDAAPDGRVR